jgi:hypothetical protein
VVALRCVLMRHMPRRFSDEPQARCCSRWYRAACCGFRLCVKYMTWLLSWGGWLVDPVAEGHGGQAGQQVTGLTGDSLSVVISGSPLVSGSVETTPSRPHFPVHPSRRASRKSVTGRFRWSFCAGGGGHSGKPSVWHSPAGGVLRLLLGPDPQPEEHQRIVADVT